MRFLRDLAEKDLLAAATDEAYLERIEHVAADLAADLARPDNPVGR